jgi:two-component system, OmpR family, sensor histidine kinase KdpD
MARLLSNRAELFSAERDRHLRWLAGFRWRIGMRLRVPFFLPGRGAGRGRRNQQLAPASAEPIGTAEEAGRERLAFFLGAEPGLHGVLRPLPYLGSAAAVLLALGTGFLIERFIGLQSVLLVFLMAILASAILWGLLPSLFACVLSVLAFNFFLVPPVYTFDIADPDNAVALFFFLLVAVIVSNLTAATRTQIVIARSRAKTTSALYGFSRKLAGIGALDDLLWATAYQVSSMLAVRTVVLMPDKEGGSLAIASGYPPEDRLEEADITAAQRCWQENLPARGGADPASDRGWLFLPLRTDRGSVGVIGIERDAADPLLTPDERRLLDALADQAAVAVERISLAGVLAEARVLAETERLRAALLTSLSHDLRTPLASILGAVSSLRSFAEQYDAAQRDDLLATLQEEAERLNRFVANLLDMTRLESGAIELRLELFDIGEIIGAALQRAGSVVAQHQVQLDLVPELPMLRLDAVLFEQVLFNLLDNAAKYSPPGSRIEVSARVDGDGLVLQVIDEGPGIPPGDLERVFDKFYRVQARDRQRAGTGLGLAICRGFVEAQGGHIEARNRSDCSGAVLSIRFPVPETAELGEPAAADG